MYNASCFCVCAGLGLARFLAGWGWGQGAALVLPLLLKVGLVRGTVQEVDDPRRSSTQDHERGSGVHVA